MVSSRPSTICEMLFIFVCSGEERELSDPEEMRLGRKGMST
jgi:hypothetical protein